MAIKKFKNGKILLSVTKSDFDGLQVPENFYHDEMFMSDLYLNQINGYIYITDFNKSLVYEYIQLGGTKKHNTIYSICNVQNPLKELIDGLTDYKKIYLYPLTKKLSLSLLQDMEEELYPDGLSDTQLNDLLWFDAEWVIETLGINEEEEEEEGE